MRGLFILLFIVLLGALAVYVSIRIDEWYWNRKHGKRK